MERFETIQTGRKYLKDYVSPRFFDDSSLNSINIPEIVPMYLKLRRFGIALSLERNEPHIVLINDVSEYRELTRIFGSSDKLEESVILNNLRMMVSFLGKKISFAHKYFPDGINFDLALILEGKVYFSTHERNKSKGPAYCDEEIIDKGICKCNVLSSQTGGAIVLEIAKKQKYLHFNTADTIQPGARTRYKISGNKILKLSFTKKTPKFSLARAFAIF